MKKKEFFITDFDDTLFYTSPAVIAYINKTYGVETKESDYLDNGGFHEIINKYRSDHPVTFNQVYNDYSSNFALSPFWHKKVEPMPYVIEVVPELAKKYDFVVATMRSDRGAFIVVGLLELYLSGLVKNIHYAMIHRGGDSYDYFSKKEFIQNFNGKIVAFVDDGLKEVNQTKELCPSFLLDPNDKYSTVEKSEKIISVEDWKKIGDLFL